MAGTARPPRLADGLAISFTFPPASELAEASQFTSRAAWNSPETRGSARVFSLRTDHWLQNDRCSEREREVQQLDAPALPSKLQFAVFWLPKRYAETELRMEKTGESTFSRVLTKENSFGNAS